MHRVHVMIRGRVQGVGFRYFVLRRAHALGLSGWVRNNRDHSVEVEAEGDPAALASFVTALREGPPTARVSDLQEEWSQGAPAHRGFAVRD